MVHDVAELVERPRRGWIERGRGAKVARRLLDLAAPLIRFGSAQMRQHRIGTQRHGAAVRFNGQVGLVAAQRGVAACQRRAVIALPGRRVIGHGRRDSGEDDQNCHEQGTLHGDHIVTGPA